MNEEAGAGATLADYTAFQGSHRRAAGSLADVTRVVRDGAGDGSGGPWLVFDNRTGRQIDVDLRHDADAADQAVAAEEARRRGRPRLGVVAREVTLLPRHWEWLAAQPGGASVALRRLVEEARRSQRAADAWREAQERCHHFLTAIAGDLPGYEDALRALYRADLDGFKAAAEAWPVDVRNHALALLQESGDAPRSA